MLTTHRRDQRTRRQALFTLETLDDRLVLSAAAAGAVVEARHEAKLDRVEARHEAKLARVEARHEAKLAAFAAYSMPSASAALPLNGTASTSVSAAPAASASAAPTASTTTTASSSTASTVPVVIANPGPGSTTTTTTSGSSSSTSSTVQPSPGPLSANVAAALQSLYTEYENAAGGTFTPSLASDQTLQISGDSVAVNLKIASGTAFGTALAQLQTDGMQVTSSSSTYGLIDGMLPIADLPAAAQIAASVNASPPPELF